MQTALTKIYIQRLKYTPCISMSQALTTEIQKPLFSINIKYVYQVLKLEIFLQQKYSLEGKSENQLQQISYQENLFSSLKVYQAT